MDKQEILTILNSLDVQVSMGRIDQPTYETLKQKWTSQLHESERPGSLPVTPSGEMVAIQSETTPQPRGRVAVEVLACPKCAAPVPLSEMPQDLSRPLRCPFCDTVYTLRQGQDNAQQLKKELLAWFDRVVVSSGQAGSAVDINARRYIFSDSLYPILKKETERRLEAFDTVLELPLVQVKESSRFKSYQPGLPLLQLAQGENQWLKTLLSRVSAEQLQHFAVVPDDRQKVQQLQVRVQNLIYYANIAQQFASSEGHAYQIIQQNILALQQSYQPLLQVSEDEQYRTFLTAQYERASGALRLVEAMSSAFDERRSVVPERLVVQVERGLEHLKKSQQLAESCTYNPLYTVSLLHGIQKDITGARIFQMAVGSYEVVTRTFPCAFPLFYRNLLGYVLQLLPVQDAEHLLWLLTSVCRVLTARAGEAPLPIVKDWRWLEGAIGQQCRRGFLGLGGERSELKTHFFHPYWVAHLHYTDVGGKLLKKARVGEGLLLIDATSVKNPLVSTLVSPDPTLPIVQAGMQQPSLFDKSMVSLPALLTHAMAERALKSYATRSALKILSSRMLGVVYLPVAIVSYQSRRQRRERVISQVSLVNQNIYKDLALTQEFLRTYLV
jgi:hypothetical protein